MFVYWRNNTNIGLMLKLSKARDKKQDTISTGIYFQTESKYKKITLKRYITLGTPRPPLLDPVGDGVGGPIGTT